MPRKCCVPYCYSNYQRTNRHEASSVSSFKFPEDQEMVARWLEAIPRDTAHWKITKYTGICIKHFRDDDISQYDPKGLPLKLFRLKPTAVPSIFPKLTMSSRRLMKKRGKDSPHISQDVPTSNDILKTENEDFFDQLDEKPLAIPKICCVPDCEPNSKAPYFSLPGDTVNRQQWIQAIPLYVSIGDDRSYYVCARHFPESEILPPDEPCKEYVLQPDAVPSLFLSSTAKEKKINYLWDIVRDIQHIQVRSKSWNYIKENDRIVFYKLNLQNDEPRLAKSFYINSDLSVDLFVDRVRIETHLARFILGEKLKCDLFSKIERLIEFLEDVGTPEEDLKNTILGSLSKLIAKHSKSKITDALIQLRAQFGFLMEDM